MICETKLHINTVTSDILRALQKAEMRVDARDRYIQKIKKEQSQADRRVAEERRNLDHQITENRMRAENMNFRIS